MRLNTGIILRLRLFIEKFGSKLFDKLSSDALISEEFSKVRSLSQHPSKEKLWQEIFGLFENKKITVLEFGVWKGQSIGKFAKYNSHNESRFYGFDSFEGLPEDWNKNHKKGFFNERGSIPLFDDNRIVLIKGWFQNSLQEFIRDSKIHDELFVHFDADIHCATLFAMLEIDKLKKPYYAVFDEFKGGDEIRALHNYIQISGAKVQFIASTGNKFYPTQVSCRITPEKLFNP